ncbi:MAG: protein-tyrosine-phosphatase [Myxococcota bacterium]|nr:protein-tyrosine-phosphatase [Myxococcota bacterium]
MDLYPALNQTFRKWAEDLEDIMAESPRRESLEELSRHIVNQRQHTKASKLLFVCTHNSRRSQLAQCLAQAAATYYDLPYIETFSGGTEATAFHPNAIKALTNLGFTVEKKEGPHSTTNPIYLTYMHSSLAPLRLFSKRHRDTPNPKTNFIAIMTCSEANEQCPVIDGSDERLQLSYKDPKIADKTPQAKDVYLDKATKIGREMTWVMLEVRRKLQDAK